jgi:hypothetical protein
MRLASSFVAAATIALLVQVASAEECISLESHSVGDKFGVGDTIWHGKQLFATPSLLCSPSTPCDINYIVLAEDHTTDNIPALFTNNATVEIFNNDWNASTVRVEYRSLGGYTNLLLYGSQLVMEDLTSNKTIPLSGAEADIEYDSASNRGIMTVHKLGNMPLMFLEIGGQEFVLWALCFS